MGLYVKEIGASEKSVKESDVDENFFYSVFAFWNSSESNCIKNIFRADTAGELDFSRDKSKEEMTTKSQLFQRCK